MPDNLAVNNINKEGFKRSLLYRLRRFNFERGFFSEADKYLEPLIKTSRPYCFNWIYELYRDNYHDELVINNLLKTLSHIPYGETAPLCIKIAEESIVRESSEIKENAVAAFENWEYAGAIPLLEAVQFNNPFLDDYLKRVIEDLKKLENNSKIIRESR